MIICMIIIKIFYFLNEIEELPSTQKSSTDLQTSEELSYPTSASSGSIHYLETGRNYDKQNIRGSIDVMTEKVVAALDSCRISYRKSVHIICAVAEALGCDTSVLILNKTSNNRSRK